MGKRNRRLIFISTVIGNARTNLGRINQGKFRRSIRGSIANNFCGRRSAIRGKRSELPAVQRYPTPFGAGAQKLSEQRTGFERDSGLRKERTSQRQRDYSLRCGSLCHRARSDRARYMTPFQLSFLIGPYCITPHHHPEYTAWDSVESISTYLKCFWKSRLLQKNSGKISGKRSESPLLDGGGALIPAQGAHLGRFQNEVAAFASG